MSLVQQYIQATENNTRDLNLQADKTKDLEDFRDETKDEFKKLKESIQEVGWHSVYRLILCVAAGVKPKTTV